ncbi:hypothetical protein H9P43_006479 [Blastocladiella emersonii ATCC 22665]|nr:hypothetical protein H9P43_006479 [Blastocladiella emersonii ATCC 22665]
MVVRTNISIPIGGACAVVKPGDSLTVLSVENGKLEFQIDRPEGSAIVKAKIVGIEIKLLEDDGDEHSDAETTVASAPAPAATRQMPGSRAAAAARQHSQQSTAGPSSAMAQQAGETSSSYPPTPASYPPTTPSHSSMPMPMPSYPPVSSQSAGTNVVQIASPPHTPHHHAPPAAPAPGAAAATPSGHGAPAAPPAANSDRHAQILAKFAAHGLEPRSVTDPQLGTLYQVGYLVRIHSKFATQREANDWGSENVRRIRGTMPSAEFDRLFMKGFFPWNAWACTLATFEKYLAGKLSQQ